MTVTSLLINATSFQISLANQTISLFRKKKEEEENHHITRIFRFVSLYIPINLF
jgi:hypothetical protein